MSFRIAEPSVIRAKTNLNWVREISGIYDNNSNLIASANSSDGFSAVYELRNLNDFLEIPTTANGNYYSVNLSATETESYSGGNYTWELYLLQSDNRWLIDAGTIKIVGYSQEGQDLRSDTKKILDAIDELLLGKSSNDVAEYTLQTGSGSRSIKTMTHAELVEARQYYSKRYESEQVKAGKKTRTIFTKFNN